MPRNNDKLQFAKLFVGHCLTTKNFFSDFAWPFPDKETRETARAIALDVSSTSAIGALLPPRSPGC
jgi:hypothetical protein